MIEVDELKKLATSIYGAKIDIGCSRDGRNEVNIIHRMNYAQKDIYHYVCYFYTEKYCVIIWNKLRHNECHQSTINFSVGSHWKNEYHTLTGRFLECEYKRIGKKSGPYEKVLYVDFETFKEILPDLSEYLKFDREDETCPNNLTHNKDDNPNLWCDENNRERHSVSAWKRKQKFRNDVLECYDCQCAICDCEEPEILEAAHIIPVSEGGSDDPKNGICLCANHHLMFDRKLLKINFNKLEIYDVADSVKKMLWYRSLYEHQPNRKIRQRKTSNNEE